MEHDIVRQLRELFQNDFDIEEPQSPNGLDSALQRPTRLRSVRTRDGHWNHLSKETFVRCTNNGGKSGKQKRTK